MDNKKIVPPPPSKIVWEPYLLGNVPLRRRTVRTPAVPVEDPAYVFRPELVREIAWAAWPHDGGPWSPSLLVGPKGSGKTSLVEQIAARCNVPVYRTNLNVGTTVRHLKGRVGAEDGATTFVPGVVTRAMEEGAWLILDEISGATPPVALSLFPVLEPHGEVLLEDAQPVRYVRRHPDFRVFATDNTIGAEQEDDRFAYAGTNDMNEALLDRFGSTVQVGYLPEMDEHAALCAAVPGLDSDLAEGLVTVANRVRESSEIQIAFSFRMLTQWARRAAAGESRANCTVPFDSVHAAILGTAGPAFLNRIRSRVERDAIVEVIRRVFATEGV